MATVVNTKVCTARLRCLQNKWNPCDVQITLRLFRRCLTSIVTRWGSRQEEGDALFVMQLTNRPLLYHSAAHALTWKEERYSYSTASLAVADKILSLSPAVKYLVNTNNISDLSLITPSGPKSRILKG